MIAFAPHVDYPQLKSKLVYCPAEESVPLLRSPLEYLPLEAMPLLLLQPRVTGYLEQGEMLANAEDQNSRRNYLLRCALQEYSPSNPQD